MEILKFGDETKKRIVLIHGFQSPYQIWDKYIEHYKEDFCVIVPVLSGHNQNKREEFNSFNDEISFFEKNYISRFGKDVYAVFGMSMGGIFASHLWQSQQLNIEKIILDGSPLVSYNKLVKKIIERFYLKISHRTQKRDRKALKQAVNSIILEENLHQLVNVIDNMSDKTISNYINSIGDYKLPKNINTPNTQLYYFHGTAINEMYAKKTAKYINKHYKNAKIQCFKGLAHCEKSLLHPEEMIKEIDSILFE